MVHGSLQGCSKIWLLAGLRALLAQGTNGFDATRRTLAMYLDQFD